MRRRNVLRILAILAVVNALTSTITRVLVLMHADSSETPVGTALLTTAGVSLALAPASLVLLWLLVKDPVHAALHRRRNARLVDEVLCAGAFQTALQPIIDVRSRRVVGVEALSRFPENVGWTPDVWFRAAHAAGRGEELEEATLLRAIEAAARMPDGFLSLNVSASVLASPMLMRVLDVAGSQQPRIVIELTEHESVTDYSRLVEARQELRSRGVRLAVDDAGAGYASMRHLVTLDPDMIKLDRSLATGVARDPIRKAMLEAVARFARNQGATVVAEGVETAHELETLAALGVDLAQGYFIAYPTTDQVEWSRWLAPAQRELTDTFDAVYVIPAVH